jgi:hypothetical protein
MSFGQSSTIANKLRDLRENLHSDEQSLLEHHSKLIDFGGNADLAVNQPIIQHYLP